MKKSKKNVIIFHGFVYMVPQEFPKDVFYFKDVLKAKQEWAT